MIQLIILIILIFLIIKANRSKENARQQHIIDTNLFYKKQSYDKLKSLGMTEEEMVQKCYIMSYDIKKLKDKGWVDRKQESILEEIKID